MNGGSRPQARDGWLLATFRRHDFRVESGAVVAEKSRDTATENFLCRDKNCGPQSGVRGSESGRRDSKPRPSPWQGKTCRCAIGVQWLSLGQFLPIAATRCHCLPGHCPTLFHEQLPSLRWPTGAGRQFGSVEKLPSGRYRARHRYEGAWLSAPTTFTTKADANAWLAKPQTDLGRGTWVDRNRGRKACTLMPEAGSKRGATCERQRAPSTLGRALLSLALRADDYVASFPKQIERVCRENRRYLQSTFGCLLCTRGSLLARASARYLRHCLHRAVVKAAASRPEGLALTTALPGLPRRHNGVRRPSRGS